MHAPPPRPLLVAHLVHRFGVGGLESVVLELIRRLPADRFRHTVICLTDSDAAMTRRLPPDVPVHALHKRPGKDWLVWFRLWRLLRRVRPHILHSCNIATLEGALPAALAGVTVRLHAEHGRDMYDLDGSNPTYCWLRRLYAPLIHAFVPVSHELEQWLLHQVRIPPAKVRLIPNGVDLTRFRPRTAPHDPTGLVMGTVGRLAPVKDHATLLRGFALLAGRFPERNLSLLLVGDGPLRQELEAQAQAAGVGKKVHFAGEQADIPTWLGRMDLFALSSLAEGMPLTLLEAMASGVACVATRTGACPRLIREGETGFLFPVGDGEALARIMARYLEEPGLAARHGAAGRARAESEYDLEQTVAHYADLMQTCWDQTHRRAACAASPE